MKPLVYARAALWLAFIPAAPALAQNGGDAVARDRAHYTACMEQVHKRPNDAFDDATTWEGLGGGYPARHCALAALVALGHYNEAAQGLEKLAETVPAEAAFKAKIMTQAARAWIAANEPARARAVAEAALGLIPDDPDGLIALARAKALAGAYWEAADDLSRVLYADPERVEALVLRGATYRELAAGDLALDDLNRALALDPTHPEGLLQRGLVHRLKGEKNAAREDWRALMENAPESEEARQAEIALHEMDSGLE